MLSHFPYRFEKTPIDYENLCPLSVSPLSLFSILTFVYIRENLFTYIRENLQAPGMSRLSWNKNDIKKYKVSKNLFPRYSSFN